MAITPCSLPTTSAKILRRGRKSWDVAGGHHRATRFGDGCRQGLSEQRIFSSCIVQTHKIQCVKPWPRLSFFSFQMGFVWSFSVRKGDGGWNLLSSGELCRKSSFHSSGWIYGHNTAWFTGSTPSFSRVYIHQLMIHLEGSLLITQQRNKHHLCLPWPQNSVRIDLSLLISTKEHWIVQNVLNRAIQNAEVKHQYKLRNSWKVFPNSTNIYDELKSR